MKDMDPEDLTGLTVITIGRSITPIYADPDPMNSPLENLFKHEQTCSDLPNFNVEQFCDALALACDGPVERTADWYLFEPDEIFSVNRAHAGNHRTYPGTERPRRSVAATI